MAGSLDELINFLLIAISECGVKGVDSVEIARLVDKFYKKEQIAENQTDDAIDPDLVSWNQSEQKRGGDRRLLEQVWNWLRNHADILVGAKGEWKHLSLAEYEQLEAVHAQRSNDNGVAVNDGKIRVFTTEQRMWQVLAGHAPDNKRVPTLEFQALCIIASTREEGILQPDLVRVSGQDKRSLPKRTDALADKGYIEKIPIFIRKHRTSLLRHVRYKKRVETLWGKPGPHPRAFNNHVFELDNFVNILLEKFANSADVVPMSDLYSALGVESKQVWEQRWTRRALDWLEKAGIVERFRAPCNVPIVGRPEQQRYLPCVRLLRTPTEVDRTNAFSFGKDNRQPGNQGVAEDEDTGADPQFHEDFNRDNNFQSIEDEEAVAIAENENEHEINADFAKTLIVSEWDPDVPVLTALHNAIANTGSEGITSNTLRHKVFGHDFGRPVDIALNRLTEHPEMSQPPHERHLAILREPHPMKSGYLYRTFEGYQEAVNKGEASWQKVFPKQKTLDKLPQPRLDEWGFPVLDTKLFHNETGAETLSSIAINTQMPVRKLSSREPAIETLANGHFKLIFKSRSTVLMPTNTKFYNKPVAVDANGEYSTQHQNYNDDESTPRRRRRGRVPAEPVAPVVLQPPNPYGQLYIGGIPAAEYHRNYQEAYKQKKHAAKRLPQLKRYAQWMAEKEAAEEYAAKVAAGDVKDLIMTEQEVQQFIAERAARDAINGLEPVTKKKGRPKKNKMAEAEKLMDQAKDLLGATSEPKNTDGSVVPTEVEISAAATRCTPAQVQGRTTRSSSIIARPVTPVQVVEAQVIDPTSTGRSSRKRKLTEKTSELELATTAKKLRNSGKGVPGKSLQAANTTDAPNPGEILLGAPLPARREPESDVHFQTLASAAVASNPQSSAMPAQVRMRPVVASEARVEELIALLGDSERPGVHINVPKATSAAGKAQAGPRLRILVTFKFDWLRDLDWFKQEEVAKSPPQDAKDDGGVVAVSDASFTLADLADDNEVLREEPERDKLPDKGADASIVDAEIDIAVPNNSSSEAIVTSSCAAEKEGPVSILTHKVHTTDGQNKASIATDPITRSSVPDAGLITAPTNVAARFSSSANTKSAQRNGVFRVKKMGRHPIVPRKQLILMFRVSKEKLNDITGTPIGEATKLDGATMFRNRPTLFSPASTAESSSNPVPVSKSPNGDLMDLRSSVGQCDRDALTQSTRQPSPQAIEVDGVDDAVNHDARAPSDVEMIGEDPETDTTIRRAESTNCSVVEEDMATRIAREYQERYPTSSAPARDNDDSVYKVLGPSRIQKRKPRPQSTTVRFNKSKLVMEILDLCGGAMGGDNEIVEPFINLFRKTFGDNQIPDHKSVMRLVKNLVDQGKLKKNSFIIEHQGKSITKAVLLKPEVSFQSAVVSSLVDNIKAAYPIQYVSPNLAPAIAKMAPNRSGVTMKKPESRFAKIDSSIEIVPRESKEPATTQAQMRPEDTPWEIRFNARLQELAAERNARFNQARSERRSGHSGTHDEGLIKPRKVIYSSRKFTARPPPQKDTSTELRRASSSANNVATDQTLEEARLVTKSRNYETGILGLEDNRGELVCNPRHKDHPATAELSRKRTHAEIALEVTDQEVAAQRPLKKIRKVGISLAAIRRNGAGFTEKLVRPGQTFQPWSGTISTDFIKAHWKFTYRYDSESQLKAHPIKDRDVATSEQSQSLVPLPQKEVADGSVADGSAANNEVNAPGHGIVSHGSASVARPKSIVVRIPDQRELNHEVDNRHAEEGINLTANINTDSSTGFAFVNYAVNHEHVTPAFNVSGGLQVQPKFTMYTLNPQVAGMQQANHTGSQPSSFVHQDRRISGTRQPPYPAEARPMTTNASMTPHGFGWNTSSLQNGSSLSYHAPIQPRTQPQSIPAAIPSATKQMITKPPTKHVYTAQDPNCIITPELSVTLLYTIIVLRTLAGGLDRTIRWTIVDDLFQDHPNYCRTNFKSRWQQMIKCRPDVVDALQSSFEDAFLAAYEKNELPPYDLSERFHYDWKYITNWAMEAVPISENFENLNVEDLQAQKFDITPVEMPRSESLREDFLRPGSTTIRRIHAVNSIDVNVRIDRCEMSAEMSAEMSLARSWIRAVVNEGYRINSIANAGPRVATIKESVLWQAINSLIEDKFIIAKTKRWGPFYPHDGLPLLVTQRQITRAYLDEALVFKKKIDEQFRMYGFMKVSQANTSAETMALSEMMFSGKVKTRGILPAKTNELDAPRPKLSPWGLVNLHYEAKKIEKQVYFWPLEVYPTDYFEYGHPCQDIIRKTPVPIKPASDPPVRARIPYWVTLQGHLNVPSWRRAVLAIIQDLARKSGCSAESLFHSCKKLLEVWEINLILQWLEDVGAAKQVHGSWAVTNWWWLVVPGLSFLGDDGEGRAGSHYANGKKKPPSKKAVKGKGSINAATKNIASAGDAGAMKFVHYEVNGE